MSNKQLAAIGRKWQRLLGLHEWRIRYVAVPDEILNAEQHLANCVSYSDTLTAKIRVACNRDPSEIEGDVCHELLHVALAEYDAAAKSACQLLSDDAQTLLAARLDEANERLVRRLERVLVQADE